MKDTYTYKLIIVFITSIVINSSLLYAQEDTGFVSGRKKSTSNKNKDKDAVQNVLTEGDTLNKDSVYQFVSYRIRGDRELKGKAKRNVKKGDFYFSLGPGKYDKALEHYKIAFAANPNHPYIDYRIGLCYLLMKSKKYKAIMYLDKAYSQDHRVSQDIHYYLGQAHHISNDYDRAIEEYKKSIREYKKAHRHDHISEEEKEDHIKMVYRHIEECQHALELQANPRRVLIENIGDSINTKYPEYDPLVNADETMMIFTSRRKDTKGKGRADIDHVFYEDLYVSYMRDGTWTKAVPMENKFNKKTNDAAIGLSSDGNKLFVYRDTHQGDIFICEKEEGGWTKPRPIKELNSEYHESAACFSADEKTIYFVSDRFGGFGGRDIYYSNFDETHNKWGHPINIGGVINTKYDEERVFMHPNGKRLYFCSKGHNSMGGYDIFYSDIDEKGKWQEPVSLGHPINTVDDDISFVITADGERGYYSSYKAKGRGDRDIYVVHFGITEKVGHITIEEDLLSKKMLLPKPTVELTDSLLQQHLDDTDMLVLENTKDSIQSLEEEIAKLQQLMDSTTNKKEIKQLRASIEDKQSQLNNYTNLYSAITDSVQQVVSEKSEELADNASNTTNVTNLSGATTDSDNQLITGNGTIPTDTIDKSTIIEEIAQSQPNSELVGEEDANQEIAVTNLTGSTVDSDNELITGEGENSSNTITDTTNSAEQVDGNVVPNDSKINGSSTNSDNQLITGNGIIPTDTIKKEVAQTQSNSGLVGEEGANQELAVTNLTGSTVDTDNELIIGEGTMPVDSIDNSSSSSSLNTIDNSLNAPLTNLQGSTTNTNNTEINSNITTPTDSVVVDETEALTQNTTTQTEGIANTKISTNNTELTSEENLIASEPIEKESNSVDSQIIAAEITTVNNEISNTEQKLIELEQSNLENKEELIAEQVERKNKLENKLNELTEVVTTNTTTESNMTVVPNAGNNENIQGSNITNNPTESETIEEDIKKIDDKLVALGSDTSKVAQEEIAKLEEAKKRKEIELKEQQTINNTYGEPLIGGIMQFENILFDFDRSTIKTESEPILEKILAFLADPPTTKLEVIGHTDSKGSSTYNQSLSEQRAKSVVKYLIEHGIDASRLKAIGYGEDRPIAPNTFPDGSDNPLGRKMNRRTEFKVIE